ncbi:hypothetical protein OSB04_008722 [Centaurea solstitialis]|uniref:Chlorophyll(Ide) b reductase NOL, chloroplastic n=1 Tax=Centaurea solstitialis TaxID=347529 RepID=A0AA38U5N3_9ASTR|nr:hypothetical protein OSB04_008722 [Centaurea solstitialis]
MALTVAASSSSSSLFSCSISPSPSSLSCRSALSSLPHHHHHHHHHHHLYLSFAGGGFGPFSTRIHQKPYVSKPFICSSSPPNSQPMVPPFNVLITGSTKGIGYALAKEFLKAGDNVLICSRSAATFNNSIYTTPLTMQGTTCDVRDDYNAGSNAYSYKPLAEASDEDLIEVVTTNTLGLMICCREAMKMMLNQPRGGHIFNIDGAGSDGRPTPRFAAYGATKRSAELRMQEVSNVVVHNLSPGMVTTDLLMSGANTKQAKFFINVLAEPADEVAEYLVPNIRSIPISGSTRPTYIRFLTGIKAYSQIFSRLAFGARRNRYLVEE